MAFRSGTAGLVGPALLGAMVVLMLAGCGEWEGASPEVRLRPVLMRDREAPVLLRPMGMAVDPVDGSLVVVESGRRTLTWLGSTRTIQARRTVRAEDLPGGLTMDPVHDSGAVLVRGIDGYWMTWEGLGPLFVPDDAEDSQVLLGAGRAGVPPADGLSPRLADLSDIRGLALDNSGNLLVAIEDQVFRVLGDSLDLIAGSGYGSAIHEGPSDRLNLSLGTQAGLAVDPDGNVYLSDQGSGRIWRLSPDGMAQPVAGGGDEFTPPSEPVSADQIALDLDRCQMVWDPQAAELVLLVKNVLYRLRPGDPGVSTSGNAASSTVIRALPAALNLARGLTLDLEGPVVSSLRGTIHRATDQGSVVLWQPPPEADPALGWAAAIERVGLSALLIQDPAQRRISLYLPGSGTYVLHAETSQAFELSDPLAADSHGHIYYVTAFGLRFMDVNGPSGLVAPRVPAPVFEGQSVTELLLPYEGEVRAGNGETLWLLDPGQGVVLSVDRVSGAVVHVAGAIEGGGEPRGDQLNTPRLVSLNDPGGLWVRDDLLLLANRQELGGSVAYAFNLGEGDVTLGGAVVPPDRVAYLGGDGEQTYTEGIAFEDLAVDRMPRLVSTGGELVVSMADRFAPPLARVDGDGVVTSLLLEPPRPPGALAVLSEGVILAAWTDSGDLVGLNLSLEERTVLGQPVPAGGQRVVAHLDSPVRDLVTSGGQDVYAWMLDGRILRLGQVIEPVGETACSSRSMALAQDGGLYALDCGGLWAVDPGGQARFLSDELPPPPGAAVMTPTEGWVEGTRIWTLPFGDNVTALAIGGDGSLYWTDGDTRGLYRAHPAGGGVVEPSSEVELLWRGGPISGGDLPVLLEAGADDLLFLSDTLAIHRWNSDRWEHFAGGGSFTAVPGLPATDLWLSGITALVLEEHLMVRSRQGLVEIGLNGVVSQATALCPSDAVDGSGWAYSRSMEWLDGDPVVIVAGELYQVVGWPE